MLAESWARLAASYDSSQCVIKQYANKKQKLQRRRYTPLFNANARLHFDSLRRVDRILRIKRQLLPHRHIQQPIRHDDPRLHVPLARHLLEPRPQQPLGGRHAAHQVHGFRRGSAIFLGRRRLDGGTAPCAVDFKDGTVGLGDVLERVDAVGDVGRAVDGHAPEQPAAVGACPADRLDDADAESRLVGLVDQQVVFDGGPLARLDASRDEGRVDHVGALGEAPEEFHGPDHAGRREVVAGRPFLDDLNAERAEFPLLID